MRRGAAPDLAFVLAAEEAGRARGRAIAEKSQSRKMRRLYARLARGQVTKRKHYLTREERAELFKAAKRRRAELMQARDRQADTPIPVAWRDAEELQAFLDDSYEWAESKAAREVRHAKVRALVAARYDELAAWAEDKELSDAAAEYRVTAEKLRAARTDGWWAFDRMTRMRYMRFRDRSGLVRLDPSESRRETARLIRRLTPAVLQRVELGERIYSAVFSIPNVPRGLLAWGKAELFRLTARALAKFPELTARVEAQEDPLAADLQSWNVHANVTLLVDPRRVTRLAAELAQQAEINLPGALGKLPAPPARDRAAPGELSYAKLHAAWGANQVQVRKLEAPNADTLAKAFAENIKYAVKFVSKKQLEGDAPATPGRGAPPLTAWPLDALHEWHQANKGRRRVRTFGALYRLNRDELPEDPELDGKLRFGGRVRVTPAGFSVEAARIHYLDLIHGDKSGAIFGRSTSAEARAGP